MAFVTECTAERRHVHLAPCGRPRCAILHQFGLHGDLQATDINISLCYFIKLQKDLKGLGSIPSRGWIIIFPSCPTSYEAHPDYYATDTKRMQWKDNGSFTPPFRTEVFIMWSFTSIFAICLDCKVRATYIVKTVVQQHSNYLRLFVWRNKDVLRKGDVPLEPDSAHYCTRLESRHPGLQPTWHAHCSWIYRLKAGARGVAGTPN